MSDAKVAGKLTIRVLRMSGAPNYIGLFNQDTLDPYIVVTLHDGKFSEGGSHVGESVKTSVKDDAGSNAVFNEEFVVAKPENMDNIRVQVWDSDVVWDDKYGLIDVDLNAVFAGKNYGNFVGKTVDLVKDGKTWATVALELKLEH